MEIRYLIRCEKCKHNQQTHIRTKGIYGKQRKCFYCGKNISLNKDNVIKKI